MLVTANVVGPMKCTCPGAALIVHCHNWQYAWPYDLAGHARQPEQPQSRWRGTGATAAAVDQEAIQSKTQPGPAPSPVPETPSLSVVTST